MSRELTVKEVLYQFKFDNEDVRAELEYMPEYGHVYKKLKTALEIDKPGYNVYFIDDFSKDKLINIMDYIEKIMETKKRPRDICYAIENDVKSPKAILLPNGKGNELKEMLEEVQNLYLESTYDFYNSTKNKEKEDIIEFIQKRRNELIDKLEVMAEENQFEVKMTSGGFAFMPLKEGEIMTEKDFGSLDKEKKEDILDKVSRLKISAQDILDELKNIELEELEKIKELMKLHFEVQLKEIKDKYHEAFNDCEEALQLLDTICENMEEELIDNYTISYEDDEEKINEIIFKYEVNVLVDNSSNEKPVVIFEEDPSISNLLGSIEYENHNNVYTTDVSLIKAGSLLKANEGCLIIRANSLLANSNAYYYLKKSLLNEKVNLDYNRGYLELLSLNGLKPDTININEKVILIGDYETYDILYNYDEDFKKIFKIRAEYEPVVESTVDTKKALVGNILKICKENNLRPLKNEAVKELAKYLSRKAEDKSKLFFDGDELSNILMLSNNKVINEGKDNIEAEDIRNVAYSEETVERELLENYKNKRILIKTEGEAVGQINGLSVIDVGYFSFGKPIRITCSCYKGEGNIIDVQKESNLSGNIHSKSINILKGYISRLNNGYSSLPVDFNLSFEQLYGKIDGDSASVAEIVSMVSALSKIPIKQNIAVTGSINQLGEIQPIGGVNEKIEGFFKTCKILGNVKDKGVLIPYANKDNLILSDEVEKAIFKGDFHIYTMEKIEDAFEVLMGTENINSAEVLSTLNKEIKKYSSKK